MVGTVVTRIGLRFRVCDSSSQIFDCSLNVTPNFCLTTRLKYCALSTWASAMISFALLSRSLRFKEPGPEIGQIRSRTSARFCWPSQHVRQLFGIGADQPISNLIDLVVQQLRVSGSTFAI